MAKSGTLDSGKDKKYGAYLRFKWSSEKTSTPGKTKITWTLTGKGRSKSPTILSTTCSLTVNGTKEFSKSKDSISYNDKTLDRGTFYITHDSNGKGTFKVSLKVTYLYDVCDLSSSKTFTLEENRPYSKCSWGSDAKITLGGLTDNFIKPEGNVKISWSGAVAGTANEIKGYKVFFKYSASGDKPTTSSYSKSITTEDMSLEYTLSGLASEVSELRGKQVVIGVQAIGTAAGYDSALLCCNPFKINSLPSVPVVGKSNYLLKSTEKIVNFEIQPGKDPDGQETKLEGFDEDDEKVNNLTISIEDAGTYIYKFRTIDTLGEYSSSVSVTVTKSESLEFSLQYNSESLLSSKNNTGLPYVVKPNVQIKNQTGGYGNINYTYELCYSTDKDFLEGKTTIPFQGNGDVRDYITHSGIYYKINVIGTDELNEICSVSTVPFYLPIAPELKGIYHFSDKLNSQNFCQDDKGDDKQNWAKYFQNYLRIVTDLDTGYGDLQLSINGENFTATQNLNEEANEMYYIFDSFNNLNVGYSHAKIELKKENNKSQVLINNYALCKVAPLVNSNTTLTLTNGTSENALEYYKVGTDVLTAAANLSIYGEGDLKQYGFEDVGSITFSGKIGYNKDSRVLEVEMKENVNNDNTVYFTLGSLYTPSNNTNPIDVIKDNEKIGKKKLNLSLSAKNVFGVESTLSTNLYVDFDEVPKISVETADYLIPGMTRTFTCSTESYNQLDRIEVYKDNILVRNQVIVYNEGEPKLGVPKKAVESSVVIELDQVNSFEATNIIENYEFKLITVNKVTGIAESSLNIYGHDYPVIKIEKIEYTPPGENSEEGITNIKYKIDNYGVNNDLIKNLVFSGEIENKAEDITIITKLDEQDCDIEHTLKSESENWVFNITSTLVKDKNNSSTRTISIPFTVFNLVPTIAYRKNHLGINISDLNNDAYAHAILVIGETSNRNQIYFKSPNNTKCEVVNFIIDGGTW